MNPHVLSSFYIHVNHHYLYCIKHIQYVIHSFQVNLKKKKSIIVQKHVIAYHISLSMHKPNILKFGRHLLFNNQFETTLVFSKGLVRTIQVHCL